MRSLSHRCLDQWRPASGGATSPWFSTGAGESHAAVARVRRRPSNRRWYVVQKRPLRPPWDQSLTRLWAAHQQAREDGRFAGTRCVPGCSTHHARLASQPDGPAPPGQCLRRADPVSSAHPPSRSSRPLRVPRPALTWCVSDPPSPWRAKSAVVRSRHSWRIPFTHTHTHT